METKIRFFTAVLFVILSGAKYLTETKIWFFYRGIACHIERSEISRGSERLLQRGRAL